MEALSTYAGKPVCASLSPAFQRERMCNQTALGASTGGRRLSGRQTAPQLDHVRHHAGGIRERRSSFPGAHHAPSAEFGGIRREVVYAFFNIEPQKPLSRSKSLLHGLASVPDDPPSLFVGDCLDNTVHSSAYRAKPLISCCGITLTTRTSAAITSSRG